MKKYEDKARFVPCHIATICNKCGRKIIDDLLLVDDVVEVKIEFGYLSKLDGQVWTFDLCGDCVIELSKGFKIKPNIRSLF